MNPQIDAGDAGGGGFPVGTRMVFDQDSAPAGWTRDVAAALDDRVLRIVTGALAHGGSWTISGLTSPAHDHGPGTLAVASHTHGPGTLAAASHTHGPGTLSVAPHDHGAGTLTVTSHIHWLLAHTHTLADGVSLVGNVGPTADHAASGSSLRGFNQDGGASTPTKNVTTGGPSVGDTGAAAPTVGGSTLTSAPAVNAGLTAAVAPAVDAGLTAATAPAVNAGLTATTAATIASDGLWRPLARDMIVCSKD